VRANKFREVEGGGTTWYASRTEAVGLGRVVPSSSTDFPSAHFFPLFSFALPLCCCSALRHRAATLRVYDV
jgi:hypothetical protein